MSVVCSTAEAEASALRAELDALRRDAERKEKKAAAQAAALSARTDELERQLCVIAPSGRTVARAAPALMPPTCVCPHAWALRLDILRGLG